MLVRLLALLVLMLVALVPEKGIAIVMRPDVQMILGTIVLIVLVVYDVFTGFILAMALIVAFFRVYHGNISFWKDGNDVRSKGPMANLVTRYITPENLHDAQNNVVDNKDFETEIIGIRGVYGEPVYGAQGIDKQMPGYEPSKRLTGESWAMK